MGRQRTDQTERFWAAVEKTETCWVWKLALKGDGYGTFRVTDPVRKMVVAHKFAYELTNGPVEHGMVVDHMCHNRACVNPEHLRAVTHKQNSEHRLLSSTAGRSGVRGVVWNEALKKWQVQVRHNRKLYIGGYFSTIEEAAKVASELRNSLFTHNLLDRTAS